MFNIFVLFFAITLLFSIYIIISAIISKMKAKEKVELKEKRTNKQNEQGNIESQNNLNTELEEHEKRKQNGQWKYGVFSVLMIATFVCSKFVWNDKGEKNYVTETVDLPNKNEPEIINDVPKEEQKVIQYQTIIKEKQGKNEEVVIKIFQDISKDEMKHLMTQIAQKEIEKGKMDSVKIVAIEDNKLKVNNKNTAISEMKMEKNGDISYEKYFVGKILNGYSDNIINKIKENMNIYDYMDALEEKHEEVKTVIEDNKEKIEKEAQKKYEESKNIIEENKEELEKKAKEKLKETSKDLTKEKKDELEKKAKEGIKEAKKEIKEIYDNIIE